MFHKEKHKSEKIPKETQTKLDLNIYTQIQNKSTRHGGLTYKCEKLFTISVLTIDTFPYAVTMSAAGQSSVASTGEACKNLDFN